MHFHSIVMMNFTTNGCSVCNIQFCCCFVSFCSQCLFIGFRNNWYLTLLQVVGAPFVQSKVESISSACLRINKHQLRRHTSGDSYFWSYILSIYLALANIVFKIDLRADFFLSGGCQLIIDVHIKYALKSSIIAPIKSLFTNIHEMIWRWLIARCIEMKPKQSNDELGSRLLSGFFN